jgi:hypothetical protein
MGHAEIETPAYGGDRTFAVVVLLVPGSLSNDWDFAASRTKLTLLHVCPPRQLCFPSELAFAALCSRASTSDDTLIFDSDAKLMP